MSRLILKTSEGGVAGRSSKQQTQERQLSKELHCVKKKVIRELVSSGASPAELPAFLKERNLWTGLPNCGWLSGHSA